MKPDLLPVSQHFIAIFINAPQYLQQSGHWQQLRSHSSDKHSQGSVAQYLNLGYNDLIHGIVSLNKISAEIKIWYHHEEK